MLDLDATDDPLHGHQAGRFFHGYYDCYCYLPLYIFCGDDLLCAKLRPSDIDGSAGALKELQRIVAANRKSRAALAFRWGLATVGSSPMSRPESDSSRFRWRARSFRAS